LKKNEELKSSLLKQIQSTDTAGNETAKELNFVKRPQTPSRLTNKTLRSIIDVANTSLKKQDKKAPTMKKTLKKTVKSKIKKMAWIKSNFFKMNKCFSLIKSFYFAIKILNK
jgi:hypothetical protein